MASLLQLSKTPEVLYLILQYLKSGDIAALLRTCKALYPTCYAQLWSSINVTGLHASRIVDLIEKRGAENLGFEHTRYLRLILASWHKPVAELLGVGKLNPRVVAVQMQCGDLEQTYRYSLEETSGLSELLKYSKSKSSKDFGIHLKAEIIRDIPRLFDLKKITRYELYVYVRESESRQPWSSYDPPIDRQIQELAGLLSQLVNLKYFSWDTYICDYEYFDLSDPRISKELENLQAAFTNMRYLETLVISAYFFHPSFFLTPPESVRTLELGGNLSPSWWRKFAACPLTNVEGLSIGSPGYPQYFKMHRFTGTEEAEQKINELILKDVAITSLKFFNLDAHKPQFGGSSKSTYLPADLAKCIFRRNSGLGQIDRRRVAYNRADIIAYSSLLHLQGLLFEVKESIQAVYAKKIAEEGESTGHAHNMVKDMIQALINGPESHPQTVSAQFETKTGEEWSDIKAQAWKLANKCQRNINDKIRETRNSLTEECVEKLLDEEDLTIQVAKNMWLEILARKFEGERKE
ncbi:hypothetical protein TWF281_002376 [Arthrobotrys megalospora]